MSMSVCVYFNTVTVIPHSANVGHSALNCEAATAAQGYSAREIRLFNALTAVKTLAKVSVLSKTLGNDSIAADTGVHVDHKWFFVLLSKQPFLLLFLIFMVRYLSDASELY